MRLPTVRPSPRRCSSPMSPSAVVVIRAAFWPRTHSCACLRSPRTLLLHVYNLTRTAHLDKVGGHTSKKHVSSHVACRSNRDSDVCRCGNLSSSCCRFSDNSQPSRLRNFVKQKCTRLHRAKGPVCELTSRSRSSLPAQSECQC